MGNNSDTRITLFDSSGDQHATTTLYTIMNDATLGSGDDTSDSGPWSIAEVAATIEAGLQANGAASATAAIDTNTKQFDIELNTTTYNLSFRDEVNSAGTLPAPSGSTATDATIQFDANGDGTTDETVSGFSNFFGLNDFFVDELADNIHETDIQTTTFTASATTLAIYTGAATTNVTISAGDTLGNIADTINNLSAGFTATVIPDGSGERLRITSDDGSNFSVNQTAGSFLTDTGMHSADVRVTQNIKVRADLEATPGNVTRSQMQWDSTKGFAGEYYMSKGDGTIVNDMAVMLQTGNAFDAAGGLASTTVSFSVRATSILSYNATLADRNEFNMEYHESLKDSLKLKTDSFSGVNLDEEMSQLILFEQSYSAAARVISVIQSMFDSLDRVIG